jgi:tRNA(Met) cytidine acetyltransferase
MNEVSSPAAEQGLEDWKLLLQRLERSGQRLVVPLAAERTDCLTIIDLIAREGERITLSDRQDLGAAVPVAQAAGQLGKEADLVVFDAFDRFSVDALCIAAGLLRGGGLLLILLPPQGFPVKDPDGCWQQCQGNARFMEYLFAELADAGALWRPGQRPPLLPPVIRTGFFGELTEDQEWALDWLNNDWPEMGPERALVAADRGRGKSLLLGRYAAGLEQPVVVTAASRRQAEVLLAQLPESRRHFVAPDELLRRGERVPLLLVDEAAMLPYGLLQDCLELADRALLATTLNGYEGTGQGFRLRFLRDQGDRIRLLGLEHPVRWGQGDLLELGLNNSLLLQPAELPGIEADEPLEIRLVSGEELLGQRDWMRQAHALMLSAHYRYRPSDLRQWLEDPNQRLYLAIQGAAVVGVLQINAEGGFDDETGHEILMGRRRPQGHLLAQMLTAQAGLRGFAGWKGWRIQRIAVRDERRRQGVGRALIARAETDAREQELDWIGSSFALDAEVAGFWTACGFAAVHLGRGRGGSSGRPAVAVLRALNPVLETPLSQLGRRLVRDLPLQLRGHARDLRAADIGALLTLLPPDRVVPDAHQADILDAVIDGHFGLDLAAAELSRWLLHALREPDCLPAERRERLIDCLLTGRGVAGETGRKTLIREIRRDLALLRERSPYRRSS